MIPTKHYGNPVFLDAVRQLQTCMDDPRAIYGVLTADHHVGYSMPIGGVIAYDRAVSPSGVGYDIGCGNKAVRLDIKADTIRPYMQEVMDEIVNKINFGIGRDLAPGERTTHSLFTSLTWDYAELNVLVHGQNAQTTLKEKARAQLGTVGGGNHYVDIFRDEEDYVWIGVHFGSRGFGHSIATGFLNKAKGKDWHDKPGH